MRALYGARGQFVAASELARRAALSRAAVANELAALAPLGYVIESHPHLGFRLLETPDRLTADDLQARLATRVIGSSVLVFEETASTNDVVEQFARNNAKEGLVVFAETQSKGRGRHGRAWASPRGKGLWFSVLLRPQLPATAISRLTVAASVAVARAVRHVSGVEARIKWPNDVTVHGRKLAGILTELRGEADAINAAILGIGIDVNCAPADLPAKLARLATSLLIETGKPCDRPALAAAVLSELETCYQSALTNFDTLISEWAELSTTLGKQIAVTIGTRRIEGYAQALDADGTLLLRKDNGQIERIVGGDVVMEK